MMSNNARVFNLDDSPIYHDSEMIRQEFFKRTISVRKPFLKNHPYLEHFPQLPVTGYTLYNNKYVISLLSNSDGNSNDVSESFEENVIKPAKKKSKTSVDDWDDTINDNGNAPVSETKKQRKSTGGGGGGGGGGMTSSTPAALKKVDNSGELKLKLSLSLKKPAAKSEIAASTAMTSVAATTTSSGRKASKRKFDNE